MDYIVENALLCDFPAWSRAASTLNVLIAGGFVDDIEDLITHVFGDKIPSMREINDFLSYKTDEIAEYLGFYSFDELVDCVENGSESV